MVRRDVSDPVLTHCSFLKKVNDTARKRYRLIAMSPASGGTLTALMERVEEPSAHYNYPSIPCFSIKGGQSAAAASVGCCFIISSIPFFISLAVGSALCVPTIHA
jgi:hypothetical protein